MMIIKTIAIISTIVIGLVTLVNLKNHERKELINRIDHRYVVDDGEWQDCPCCSEMHDIGDPDDKKTEQEWTMILK